MSRVSVGELQCEVVVIHVYLPITLRVATGFKSRDSTAFSLWTRALSRLATSFCQQQQQPVLLCQGFMSLSRANLPCSPWLYGRMLKAETN